MTRQLNRRAFVTSLACTGVARGMLSGEVLKAEGQKEPLPIVDTHQHVWDLSKVRLPWLQSPSVKQLSRNFDMVDYARATRNVNVVKSVYIEATVHPDDQHKEAEYALQVCRQDNNPMVAAVIGGSPQKPTFAAYARKYASNKYVKGVRAVLHHRSHPKGMCLESEFVNNIRLLGDLGMSFDLCMRPGELIDGAKLVDRCPQTRFVVDHCGKLSVQNTDKQLRNQWEAGIKALAGRDNVICKISGVVWTAKSNWKPADLADTVKPCLEAFGEDHVCFAGNWPVCRLKATFEEWVDALKTIVRDQSTQSQRKLFHDNAAKFYRL